jgi:hypothetical protein
MPDLPPGGSSPAEQPRRGAGTRAGRGSVFWMLFFGLAFILGGTEALVLGLVRQQDAARLAAAPVCVAGQQSGCRLDEQVIVVSLTTESAGRAGTPTQIVNVQTPDGNTQSVYAGEHDVDLWSRLYVNEAVQAELWNGRVIRLDDGAGHYLLADDSPVVTAWLFPLVGLVGVSLGGLLLARCVWLVRRQRTTPR